MSSKAPAGSKSAAQKLAAVTQVQEPKDINYAPSFDLVTYNFKGQQQYTWNIETHVIDLRNLPDAMQASTIEIDLDDSDYVLLQDPLFAHWAFDIENVSLSTSKKFKTTRLTNSTNNQYLGDNSDLEWVLGQRPIDYTIGGVTYRLCGISSQDTTLTLTFEDRTASLLRDKSGFKSVRRGTMTRAGFVAMLCREAGVDYWIPEINVTQPIAPPTTTSSQTPPIVEQNASNSPLSKSQPRGVTGQGIVSTAGLTVKGSPMTDGQRAVANTLLDVGLQLGAGVAAMEAVICAGILESGLSANDTLASLSNPSASTAEMATAFFQGDTWFTASGGAIKVSQRSNDPMYIASQVEAPTPFDSRGISTQYERESGFNLVAPEATRIVLAYGGGSKIGIWESQAQALTTKTNPYNFTRGPNEDSYDCIMRLASEVAWYAFVRQNRLWYVSGNYLFQQDPQMTVVRGKSGVDSIDLDLDMGARDSIAQCTINARTDLWAALPGMVVQINQRGPATGKWMVSSVTTHPLDLSQDAQIIVQKPVPKRSEPAPTTTTSESGAGAFGGTAATSHIDPADAIASVISGATPGSVEAAFNAATYLSSLNLHYTTADRTLTRSLSPGQTWGDCSATVAWVLLAAGFALPGGVTWGGWAPTANYSGFLAPGPGRYMTIYASFPHNHVFIHIQPPGLDNMQGNTVNDGRGPGFKFFDWNATGLGGYGGPSPFSDFPTFHYPGT